MENINLFEKNFVDHKHTNLLFKNEILWNFFETEITVQQSDMLVEMVIKGVGNSSCMCCIQEVAKYIIKKVTHKELKLNPSQSTIQKFIDHCTGKVSFKCEEVQTFIKELSN